MTFHEACKAIIEDADGTRAASLNWAVRYAKHGLEITSLDDQKIQAIYILSNIRGWRGDKAKEVRAFLKELMK